MDDQSERVVKLRYGAIIGIAEPGFNFKIPFVDTQAIREFGVAEGDAIKSRGVALKQNAQPITLTQAEKWNDVPPETMITGGAVPFLTPNASTGND